jgi:hypothetical protein
MKSKKVLAILLSMAIMVTFMPTMAFAAYGDADNVKCTVTLNSGDVVEKSSIADAVAAVDNGGSIKIEGEVNNSFSAFKAGDYAVDYHDATLANGVTIAPAEGSCWVGEDGVFALYSDHAWEYDKAVATPQTKLPYKADVVLYCSHGHEVIFDGVVADDSDVISDTEMTYSATVEETGFESFNVSWTVTIPADEVIYSLGDCSYKQAADGFAIKDAEGKVQITAKYYKQVGVKAPELVYDDNGDPVLLKAEIKDSEAGLPATEDAYGTTIYTVEFTFPDETTVGDIVEVTDVPKLTEQKNTITGVQFAYKESEDAEEAWVDLENILNPGDDADAEKVSSALLVRGEDNSLTYRLVWATLVGNDAGAAQYGDATPLPVDETESAKTKKACGEVTYCYEPISVEYKDLNGSKHTFAKTTAQLPKVYVEGTHEYEDRDSWSAEFIEVQQLHNSIVNTYAKCKYCEKEWGTLAEGTYEVPKTKTHTFKTDDNDKEIVYTVAATCENYGYTYKWCTSSDGWNGEDPYYLDEDNEILFVKAADDDNVNGTGGHPVLVDVTSGKVAHKFYKVNPANVNWDYTDDEDAVCTVTEMTCLDCDGVFTYVFHEKTAAEAKDEGIEFDSGSDDTVTVGTTLNVYGAITKSVVAGKNCSEKNTVTYTVTKVVPTEVKDNPETDTVGPHSFKNTVSFSNDGKTASVLQQCKEGCGAGVVDVDGNNGIKTVPANVTSEDNADGSTTYTASLDGVALGTKTVFDLTKATVVVNGGEVLDLNTLEYNQDEVKAVAEAAVEDAEDEILAAGTAARTAAEDSDDATAVYQAAYADESAKYEVQSYSYYGVYTYYVVEYADTETRVPGTSNYYSSRSAAQNVINEFADDAGNEAKNEYLDGVQREAEEAKARQIYNETFAKFAGMDLKDLVEVTINGAVIDKKLYDVVLAGPEGGKFIDGVNKVEVVAVPDTDAVGSALGTVNCIEPGTLYPVGMLRDDEAYDSGEPYEFDGKAHVFVAKAVFNGNGYPVTDATIKYAVVTEDEIIANDFDASKLPYDLDKVELTDAGEYIILAKVSKDGYTTAYRWVGDAVISPQTTGAVITTETKVMKYGDTLVATTGDAELDKLIGLSTEKASKKGYSEITYPLADLVSYDPNYQVRVDENAYVMIEKRNAKVVLKDVTKVYDGAEIDPTTLYSVDGVVNDDDLNVVVNTEGDKKIPTEPGVYVLVATANNANYDIQIVNGTLTINKIAQKVTSVSPTKKTYKANKKTNKLAKKQKFTLKATTEGDAKAKVTFKKSSGNKNITVSSKGKVTVKKGLKKGKYTVKVIVTKAETAHYAKATKTVKVTVKVK